MKYLVTGAAGFIGMHVSKFLLEREDFVIGIDNLNDYYDIKLKKDRLINLGTFKNFSFLNVDICTLDTLKKLFFSEKFDRVIHLAAQPGVRYSFVNPHAYIDSNVTVFLNIPEVSKDCGIDHLVYASSSSVYGDTNHTLQSEVDSTDAPASLYAATKKLMN